MRHLTSSATKRNVQAADAKEVGVGNPAEETCCHPNNFNLDLPTQSCQPRIFQNCPGSVMAEGSVGLRPGAVQADATRRGGDRCSAVLVRSGVAKARHHA